MKNKKLIIIGAGETANLAYEYFTHDSEYEVVAFCVNSEYKKLDFFHSLPVIEYEKLLELYPCNEYYVFVALAGEKLNRNRERLYLDVKKKGYNIASYVSSRAFVWGNVEIGENCFILEHNVLQPFTRIGNNVIMWSGNHLGHQSVVCDNCFISSHCVIAGFCEIGANSYLGINCSIGDNVKVGRDNYIGMGAIIVKNTKQGSFYSGEHSKRLPITSYDFLDIKKE